MPDSEDARWRKRNGVVAVLVGLGLVIAGAWLGKGPYVIIRTWPTVDAEATGSAVLAIPTSNRDHPKYVGYVEFRYTVGGKEYVEWSSPVAQYPIVGMHRKVARYRPGTHHLVRYNPANPSQIRFDVGYNLETFLLPAMLLAFGLLFSAAGIKALREAHRPVLEGVAGPGLWQRTRTSRPATRLRHWFTTPKPRLGPTIRCQWCGKHVEANQNLCPKCGRALHTA